MSSFIDRIKTTFGKNGKITKYAHNYHSYYIFISLKDYTKRNNRINKTNNEKYWERKLKKEITDRKYFLKFETDNKCAIWTEKLIKEERKEKLKKIDEKRS
jgi:hypothetical protein